MTNLHVLCPFLNICACLWFRKVSFLLWKGNESGGTSAMVASLGECIIWGARGGGERRKIKNRGGGGDAEYWCCSAWHWNNGGCTQPLWRSLTPWDMVAVLGHNQNMNQKTGLRKYQEKNVWGQIYWNNWQFIHIRHIVNS